MNSVHFVYPHPRIGFGFLLGASVLAISLSSSSLVASPPSKAEREVSRGLEKVGNFFFRVARKLEQAGFTEEPEPRYFDERPKVRQEPSSDEQIDPSTGLVLPPGYPQGYRRMSPQGPPPSVRGTQRPAPRYREQQPNEYQPPNFQENPQARVPQPRQSTVAPVSPAPLPPSRSQLSIPVNPSTEPTREAPREPSFGATTAPQESLSPEMGGNARSASPSAAPKPNPSVTLPFAEPVPGKRGFVYPPGAEHDMKSMLDVRDFTPGQKVRDPRTGKMFLVPPTDGSH